MNAAARPEMISARRPEWKSSLLGHTPPQPGGLRTGRPSYLEITDLTVSFGSFTAVDGVDLVVNQGDLRFLIGPNGAGKTTLIDAVTGLVPARGSIDHDGHQLVGRKTHRITRLGVGRTFQTASRPVSCCAGSAATGSPSWWSTTWSSCAATPPPSP